MAFKRQQTDLSRIIPGNLEYMLEKRKMAVMENREQPDSSEDAFILRLPDEILDRIIAAASLFDTSNRRAFSYRYKEKRPHRTAWALCLVSKRINRVATPYLYADLMVDCRGALLPTEALRQLHRTCKTKPSLWRLCRGLILHCTEVLSEDNVHRTNPYLYVAADFVTWFTAVRSLVLFGLGTGERVWLFLRSALQHMKGLTEVALLCDYGKYNLNLATVVETFSSFDRSSIRTLQLEGVSTQDGARALSALQKHAGTAPFKVLKLGSFLQTPDVLIELLRWPARLEEFSLEFSYGFCYSEVGLYTDWSLAMLQPILDMHKTTLRAIKIRAINRGGLDGFDLRDFTSLEELCLSSETTSSGRSTTSDIHLLGNLLAPRLRVFHWDLTLEDQQHCESMSSFQEEEEDWVRALANAAVARGRPLRRIDITFEPQIYEGYWGDLSKAQYPWDRMDGLGREFMSHGMQVCYNPPSIGREEYLEYIENSMKWRQELATSKAKP